MKAVPLSRYLVFFALATIGFLVDLVTKNAVFAYLGMPGGETRWIWSGVLGLQTSLNEGALFGLGQGYVYCFTALSVFALAALALWLFVSKAARDRLLTVAMGCVAAGILGNLYDRVGLPGLRWNYTSEL